MSKPTAEQLEILRHAVGLTYERSADALVNTGTPTRRHACANPGAGIYGHLLALVELGHMTGPHTSAVSAMGTFLATEQGIALARDDEKARRAAAGLRAYRVVFPFDGETYSEIHHAKSRSAAKWCVIREMDDAGWTVTGRRLLVHLSRMRAYVVEPKRRAVRDA